MITSCGPGLRSKLFKDIGISGLNLPAVSAPTITAPASSPSCSALNGLTISGGCQTGDLVNLAGASTATTACIASAYSFSVTQTSDSPVGSPYTFDISQTDLLSGNTSSSVTTQWIRVTTTPTAPTPTSPAASPFTSGANSLTLSGPCETGDTVALTGDSTQNTTCTSGAYSFTINKSVDATYNFNVTQTNCAGTASSPAAFIWVRDSTVPSAPTISSPALNPYYTNGNAISISGGCTTGDTVQLSGADSQSVACVAGAYGFTVASQTSDGSYTYFVSQTYPANGNTSSAVSQTWTRMTALPPNPTITTPAISPYASAGPGLTVGGGCITGYQVTLGGDDSQTSTCVASAYSFAISESSDATYNYTVRQTDFAGNNSGNAAQQWLRDSSTPGAPVISTPASSPHYSNTNSITVAGTCTTGMSIQLSGDDSQSQACVAGAFSFAGASQSSDGTYNYSVVQVNPNNGNASSPANQVWVRITSNPPAPTIASPVSNPYTSAGPGLVISGGCVSGNTIVLAGDESQSTVCAAAAYSFTISETVDATYNYSLTQVDLASNSSGSVGQQWVRDSAVPANPTVLSPASSPHYTNTNSIVISGGCTNTYQVILAGDDSQNVICAGGSYTFTVATQTSDGTYNYSVQQKNLGSGATSGTVGVQWIRVTSTPSTPTITNPTPNPYASGTASIVLSGACTTGDTVSLTGDDTQNVVCAASAYSFTINEAVDGVYLYSVKQTDLASNSSASASLTWTKDTTTPGNPTVSVPASSPKYSNTNSITIGGLCSVGMNVVLSGDDSQSAACAGGVFSFNVSTQTVDGTYNYTVNQTNPNNGSSSGGVAVQWIRMTSTPSTPTVTSPSPNPYASGGNSISIAGACTTGYTVNLAGSSTQNTTCAGSAYSFTVNKALDGVYPFTVSQTDPASNTSGTAPVQWTRDTTTPVSPSITTPTSSPKYTNTNSITIAGACTSGATVVLAGDDSQSVACASSAYSFTVASQSSDGTYNYTVHQANPNNGNTSATVPQQWIRLTATPSTPVVTSPAASPHYSNLNSLTLSGTCTTGYTVNLTGASTQSFTCAASAFSFVVNQSSDGTYNFGLTQTDPATNVSGGAAFQWQRSTVTPSTPVITTPAATPYSSNSTNLTISGSCATGGTVNLSGASSQSFTCAASAFSFSVTKTTDALYVFGVTQTDPYGNVSASAGLSWTLDRVAPAAVTVTNPTANPFVSGDTTISIAGTCVAGHAVNITGATTSSATCSGGGTYSFPYTNSSDGTYNFSLTQTDLAGNVSSATGFQWVRNTTIPASPVITSPATSPYYSATGSITISGTCTYLATGMDVEIYNPDGSLNQTIPCPVSGIFTSSALSQGTDGSYTYTVDQTDTTSGATSATVAQMWTRDTALPAAPAILNPSSSPYTAGGNLTVSGTCEANATVNITGSLTQNTTCTAGGTFSTTLVETADATYNFTFKQTDLAGNQSAAGASLQWIRSSSVPSTPTVLSPSATPFYSNSSSLTVSGGCTFGMTVFITGVVSGEVTSPAGSLSQACSASNTYSFTIAKSSDGTYPIGVYQQDSLLNNSGTYTQTWVRDTVLPILSVTVTPSNPNLALTAGFTFSCTNCGTKLAPTAAMLCSLDGAAYGACTSPVTLSGLSNGSRNYAIQIQDAAGNTSSPYSYAWTQQAANAIALYHMDNLTLAGSDSGLYSGAYHNDFTSNTGVTSVAGQASFGNAYNVAGGVASAPDTLSFATPATMGTFTAEAYVKFASFPASNQQMAIVSKNQFGANSGWELMLRKQGSKLKLRFQGTPVGGTVANITSSSLTLSTSTWYHVAVIFSLGTVRIYLDGAQVASGTLGTAGTAKLANPTTQAFRVGQDSTGATNQLDGVVDEVRISQIVRYTGAFTKPAGPFTAD